MTNTVIIGKPRPGGVTVIKDETPSGTATVAGPGTGAAATAQLIGTATAAFDTLGEIETQVLAVDINVNALEQQVSTLANGSSYTLYFENALI